MKAQEELLAKEKLARQRAREKAQRERRKAKKIAESGGEITPKKVCPCCGKEFLLTSNRQIFCSKKCWYANSQKEKKALREAERSDHFYRQRTCIVCGKPYWPTHSQQTLCSEMCRKQRHNEITLAFYHEKQAKKMTAARAQDARVPSETIDMAL